MGWEGPYRDDGSGPIGAVVADARANGILWVNSAGNEAETHWSGRTSRQALRFTSGTERRRRQLVRVAERLDICGFLKWDEWPWASSDFDLALVLRRQQAARDLGRRRELGQSPFEAMCAPGERAGSRRLLGDHRLRRLVASLDLSPGPRRVASTSRSIGSASSRRPCLAMEAESQSSVLTVAAFVEPYSSQGPTIDGRIKPEIVGHDSVSSATYGRFEGCTSGFAGTSASSPEVAAAAALVKQAYPTFGPDQIKEDAFCAD
jgi:subtilisin family serine protease